MILYSLITGLLAWALAALAIKNYRRPALLVAGSMLLAGVSAVLPFFELRRRAFIGDWSAILDTVNAIILGVIIMLSVTLILNLVALLLRDNS